MKPVFSQYLFQILEGFAYYEETGQQMIDPTSIPNKVQRYFKVSRFLELASTFPNHWKPREISYGCIKRLS
jgi:hypothetical protein